MKHIGARRMILLCLAILFAPALGMSITAYAEQAHTHTGTEGNEITFLYWQATDSLPNEAGNYCLTADVTLSSTWEVPGGTTNFCLNGHTISRSSNSAEKFSLITVPQGATFDLYDCAGNTGCITGGEAVYGGGVSISGMFTMHGGSITENTADSDGGGVYVSDGASFTMAGGTIIGNTAGISDTDESSDSTADPNGGGVYVSDGSFNMTGGTISGNSATINGGGVYVSEGSFTMTGGTISSNSTVVYGGGAYVAQGTFTMSGGTISGNTAYLGSVCICDSDFDMTGGTIRDNNTEFAGGGVFVLSMYTDEDDDIEEAGATFNMSGGTIENNVVGYCGGGVYIGEGKAVFTISGEAAIIGNSVSASDDGQGGGVCIYSSSFVMSGGTISNNTAYDGGGIYIGSAVGQFTMNGGTISGNTALTNGGGVSSEAAQINMTGGTISGNKALKGGGLYAGGNEGCCISGGTICGNTAYVGGGVDAVGLFFSMSGGTVSGNKAYMGGGAYVGSKCTFTMSGTAAFTGNSAGNGGGVCIASISTDEDGNVGETGAIFDMRGGTISNNTAGSINIAGIGDEADNSDWWNAFGYTADLSGGGVYVGNGASFTVTSGTISRNSAVKNGGGAYVTKGTFTISGTAAVAENSAENGGGISVCGGSLTMTGSTISDNNAETAGGGVFIASMYTVEDGNVEETGAIFDMRGGAIENNMAGCCGGGVYTDEGENTTFTMSGGTISDNTANDGGGVYAVHVFTMSSGTISGNSAVKDGGGVYAGDVFTMSGTAAVTGNSAENGGGAYTVHAFTMSGGTISDNTADSSDGNSDTSTADPSGGGVYVCEGGSFTMSGGTISGNSAVKDGGGAYIAKCTSTLSGTAAVTGNSAGNGGGMSVRGGSVTMSGGTISGNDAETAGGGVFVAGMYTGEDGNVGETGATFDMSGGTIENNMAGYCGGGMYTGETAVFRMSAEAAITGNSVSASEDGHGGGVCIYGISFGMSGGTISGNTANDGAGVYTGSFSGFDMSGGTISSNTANDGAGGGVYANDAFTMSGTAAVTGNSAEIGGGVYAVQAVTMSGTAAVTGNMTAGFGETSCAGGMFIGDTLNLSGAPVITGNTDGGKSSNVYLNNNTTITVGGALTPGEQIGVTMAAPGLFTGGSTDALKASDYISRFTSDDHFYIVEADGSELRLEPHIHDDIAFLYWHAADSLPNEAGNYCLTADVTLSSTWEVPDGTTTLCLNGHTITRSSNSAEQFSLITVPEGATFNLYDCADNTGRITGGQAVHGGGMSVSGIFTMYGGTISGNTAGNSGGGVSVSGIFTMYGGIITNNSAGNGGGVSVSGTFTMRGGTISGNTAGDSGGGVSVSDTFTMAGGIITGNSAGNNGGGVSVSCIFIMSGGTVENNMAGYCGGGVFTIEDALFRMSADAAITGNSVSASEDGHGGGVCIYGMSFDMSGGTVSSNTANDGGGVYTGSFSRFDMTGGTISGNTAYDGGGVYAGDAFTMSGTAVVTGNSAGNGGGVYAVHAFTMSSAAAVTGNSTVASGENPGAGGIFIGDTINLSGAPVISGNTDGGKSSNVYLNNSATITVGGALTLGEQIGVTMVVPGVFTSGWAGKMGTADPADFFTSANEGCNVYLDAATGEARLSVPRSVTVSNCTNGSVTVTPERSDSMYGEGETVTLNVTPNEHCTIGEVSYNDGSNHTVLPVNSVYSFTMPNNNVTVTAIFLKPFDHSDITVEAIPDQIYTGNAITPPVTIRDNGTALEQETDYTVMYSGNINAGTATVTVEGKGNYFGTKAVTFTVQTKPLTIAAKNQVISVGDAVPDLLSPVLNTHYTVTGLVGTDTLTTEPSLDYQKNGSTVIPDNTTAGIYDIVPSGATASENYTVIYIKGLLNIREGLVLPAFLTRIEESAFEGIVAQRVYISENVVSIEKRAFANCNNLREIFIPATVQSIDNTALAGCVNVTVYGAAGSEAQRFAIAAGFDFVDPIGAE